MPRAWLPSILSLLCLAAPCFAKSITLRGFVTAVHSPTSFEMDEYTITDDTEREHERLGSVGKKDYHSPQLRPGALRIGLEVEVKGDYNRKTGQVKATGIKALWDDSDPANLIESIGLVEDRRSLQKNGQHWTGSFAADGETLVVTADTQISVKRSRGERKDLRHLGLESTDDSAFSPADIDLDTFVHYVGVRQPDHSVLTKEVEFRPDRAAADSDWKTLAAKVFQPHPDSPAGTLSIDERQYNLFPSTEAQEYLAKLGASLIPPHQRELPADSPHKMLFRFFLVDSDTVFVDTYANGIVVVSARVFDLLDHEAQLAFLLSHQMAAIVEKHQWIASHYREGERAEIELAGVASSLALPGMGLPFWFAEKGIMNGFARSLLNQQDRIGIEYMVAAGYDPNESAEFWRTLERKHAKGHFWGNHDWNLIRRTYLESELVTHYANRDFSGLKRDSAEFHAAAGAIQAVRHSAKSKRK
ncbi:MAG TPA: M48 family metalloprotease [Candidatus Sulfotelmatobacter sp.]|nr:M48 family metalloprotease [Candidatus Sulfotelmatobacter sp.]